MASPPRSAAAVRTSPLPSWARASAPMPAPTMAAVKSEPPRPSVVVTPSSVAAMKPPITTILFSASAGTMAARRGHDGSGEVGTAAAERGGDAILGGRDEAAHHYDLVLRQRGHDGGEARVGLRIERRGLRVAAVGDDHLAGIQVRGVHAEVAEGQRDDVAGEPLAVTGDGVDGARGQLAQHGQAFD